MNLIEFIIGIILLVVSIIYGIIRIYKTPKDQNFSEKAILRWTLFAIIASIGGICLIVFSLL